MTIIKAEHPDPMGVLDKFDDEEALRRIMERPELSPKGGLRPSHDVVRSVDEGDGATPMGAADYLFPGWVPFHLTVLDEHAVPIGTVLVVMSLMGELTARYMLDQVELQAELLSEGKEANPIDLHMPLYRTWGVSREGRLMIVGLVDERKKAGYLIYETWKPWEKASA